MLVIIIITLIESIPKDEIVEENVAAAFYLCYVLHLLRESRNTVKPA